MNKIVTLAVFVAALLSTANLCGQTNGASYTFTGIDMIYVAGNGSVNGFYIGKFEVTQQQWTSIMGNNPSHFKNGDNYPVENVSWEDIVGIDTAGGAGYTINGVTYYKDGFCYKLSVRSGGGRRFRLPTSAEWQYAAKSGLKNDNYTFAGSNSIGTVAWYSSDKLKSHNTGSWTSNVNANMPTGGSSHVIGTKAPNFLGIYDMSGNVYEWCSDNSMLDNGRLQCLLHSGSWHYNYSHADVCRVTFVNPSTSTFRYSNIGFRLVLGN